MINQIEASIVSRLKDKLPSPIKVEAFPESPQTHQWAPGNGSVYVRFQGEDMRPNHKPTSASTAIIMQESIKTFVISVINRNLRASLGIYELLPLIKRALRGYKPIPGCSKIWIDSSGFVEQEKGVWHYEVWASVLFVEVEEQDPVVSSHLQSVTLEAMAPGDTVPSFGSTDIVENEAPDPADETVTFTSEGYSRTEPMPPHEEPDTEF